IPEQPQAVVLGNGKQTNIPLKCLYYEGKMIEYSDGIDGCFRIMPTFDGNRLNKIGSALYLSPRVKKTLFAHMYLFDGKDYSNFKLVYSDDDRSPLALYQGRQIGPLMVWKVNYPDYIEPKKEYMQKEYPNVNVTKPKFYD
ncbi:hypothetical protein HYX19_00170, partial [Candidatus Woesearchaeota archaeon]|nr:hypothetical protein [Candidatus Woesearchaeota archaeon]